MLTKGHFASEPLRHPCNLLSVGPSPADVEPFKNETKEEAQAGSRTATFRTPSSSMRGGSLLKMLVGRLQPHLLQAIQLVVFNVTACYGFG